MRKFAFIFLGTLMVSASFGSWSAKDSVYLRAPVTLLTKKFIKKTNFNRDHLSDDLFALGYMDKIVYDRLDDNVKSKLVLVDEDIVRYTQFNLTSLIGKKEKEKKGFFEDYHTYQTLTQELQAHATNFPDLLTLESAGKSVQGRELWFVKIKSKKTSEHAPNLLYIANMHGDEVAGKELMIYLIRDLLNGYGKDQRITNLVDHSQIFIMPSMNPDGNEARRRSNAHGVDLNRDFPDFEDDPTDTSEGRAPETVAIMKLHEKYQFALTLNFHGGEVCFNLPWDTKANQTESTQFGDLPLIQTLGRSYTLTNKTMYDNHRSSFDHGLTFGYEWYEIDGGLQDYTNYFKGSTHATVELSKAKWPSESSLPTIWAENKESILRFLESGLHGVHLNVIDEEMNPVLNVTVFVSSAKREIKYFQNFIHRSTLEGLQEVMISAHGFKIKKVMLESQSFNGKFETVILEKN